MTAYHVGPFSQVGTLKRIGLKHLLAFLKPYEAFLAARGVSLPSPEGSGDIDYEGLIQVFMNPGADTPHELAEALYLVAEMATPEGMDALLQAAKGRRGIHLHNLTDPTPAEVAVQVYLQNRTLLERQHAEHYLTRPRSFEYFQATVSLIPPFNHPGRSTLQALEQSLDGWFADKKRGRGTQVLAFPKPDGIWFLVKHGDPFRREGSLHDGQSSSVFYRPEKYDVLIYRPAIGEFSINARSKGEKTLYRELFGYHLFGDKAFFPGTEKYTLEPLRRDGDRSLVCSDIEGIDCITLKEIHFFWGGIHGELEVRKANDVFAAFSARGQSMPAKPRLIRAHFEVKFTDAKKPRSVVIRPSNIANYTRDSDSPLIEAWLTKRGFIVAARTDEPEPVTEDLADA